MRLSGLDRVIKWLTKRKITWNKTPNKQQSTNNQLQATIDHLSELVDQKLIPGIAISIYRGDQPLVHRGFGYADLEKRVPVTPGKTLFRAASVSKPITACALASLVAAGHIKLEASIYEYVPYFPKKKYDFTVKQLAAHTAGIRGYRGKEYAFNEPYTIRDSLQVFQEDPLLFKPGTEFHYNSYGYVLLSLAMQEVAAMPFADYVREKVLIPLGMTNTRPENPNTINQQRASFYTKRSNGFQKATPVDNRYKLAGGGYLTTTTDMIRLGQAILEKRLYPKEMSAILEAQEINGKSTYYGLGWEVSEDAKGRPYFGHIGNQVGGYSYFRIFPDSGLIVAALVNCTAPKIQELLDGIVEEFQAD